MHQPGALVARRGEVEARMLADAVEVDAAVAFLDEAESTAGVPLVDEAERERLRALDAGESGPDRRWRSLSAHRGAEVVGYAGVVVPDAGDAGPPTEASADLAIDPAAPDRGTILSALLAGLEALASHGTAERLRVWMRHVDADDVAGATTAGYEVERRLGVLGRHLDEPSLAPEPPPGDGPSLGPEPGPGVRIRAYRPDVDDEEVVAVLAAAYAGTADAGWDHARFRERRGWSWFRPEDLLVAELDDGPLGGLHWLKRRGGGVGEVYNLAVHPEAQGRRLGPALLAAGLDHLRAVGCHDVLLWVDLANERAVRLYTGLGFTTRWEDVALTRALPPSPGQASSGPRS
jgi:mycothiol synthase